MLGGPHVSGRLGEGWTGNRRVRKEWYGTVMVEQKLGGSD